MKVSKQYAHVLLFECPRCGTPLASACLSVEKNLEVADGHWFNPHCPCGWTGNVIGAVALQHWVEPWAAKAPIGAGAPGSCDGEPLK